MGHFWHLVYSKLIVSFGNPSILSDFFCHHFSQNVHMLFPLQRACIWIKKSADCLVLGHHDQDRKVSAKSVTMRGTTF